MGILHNKGKDVKSGQKDKRRDKKVSGFNCEYAIFNATTEVSSSSFTVNGSSGHDIHVASGRHQHEPGTSAWSLVGGNIDSGHLHGPLLKHEPQTSTGSLAPGGPWTPKVAPSGSLDQGHQQWTLAAEQTVLINMASGINPNQGH